ncbi:MAG: threonine/serine exporter family protein [Oscillospiraceae bacterium]|nr:threonine/serine exporter family protein [Oscillospiraceae bacterium]
MNHNALMELVSTLASRLAASGAETYRVEESVRRICSAYGLDSRVYAIPHTLLITIMIPGERPLTQLCRMDHLGTDLEAVEQYSNLSRRICTEKPDWEEALRWLDISQQTQARYGLPMDLLGHVLVSSGFCLFFGGSGMDALCAGLCGLLLGFLTRFLGKTNAFFQKIISAFLMALLAYGCSALGLTDNVDTSVIGALMLLVPGILFTNALRDITFGDTNSGINRIVEVVLIAVAISLGTAAAWNLSVSLWGAAVNTPVLQYGPVLQCVFAIIASYGFVVIFNIHGFGSFLCALGGGITWAAFCVVQALGGQDLMCFFLATVVAAVFAEVMARIRKYPAISYLISCLLPLIPGSGIYYAAQQAMQGNSAGFVSYAGRTLAIAGVMAVGILLVVTTTKVLTGRRKPGFSIHK